MAVKWNSERTMATIGKAVMIGIARGSESVRNSAVTSIMSGEKTGRIYRRRGVEHQASAPGESPASDTGHLVQSGRVDYEVDQSGAGIVTARVVFASEYALGLEMGTRRVEPRPFLRPALAENLEFIKRALNEEIAAVLK